MILTNNHKKVLEDLSNKFKHERRKPEFQNSNYIIIEFRPYTYNGYFYIVDDFLNIIEKLRKEKIIDNIKKIYQHPGSGDFMDDEVLDSELKGGYDVSCPPILLSISILLDKKEFPKRVIKLFNGIYMSSINNIKDLSNQDKINLSKIQEDIEVAYTFELPEEYEMPPNHYVFNLDPEWFKQFDGHERIRPTIVSTTAADKEPEKIEIHISKDRGIYRNNKDGSVFYYHIKVPSKRFKLICFLKKKEASAEQIKRVMGYKIKKDDSSIDKKLKRINSQEKNPVISSTIKKINILFIKKLKLLDNEANYLIIHREKHGYNLNKDKYKIIFD